MEFDALEAELRLRLRLRPVGFPEFGTLRLWLAHPGSRLGALADRCGAGAPYWGYPWPGGLALARYLTTHPEIVAGRRVVDFGAGCGLLGCLAHLRGAACVGFVETDPLAMAAARLNAAENGLVPAALDLDSLGMGDVVLAGDVFYDPGVAAASVKLLAGLASRKIDVLIGDPFRPDLPLHALRHIASYDVREVGTAEAAPATSAGVFALR